MMTRSNCLVFAWTLYWRRYKKGCTGFVAARKSHWGPFPHFLYVRLHPKRNTWRFVSFVPLHPERKRFPPLFFQGRVRWGDAPPVAHRVDTMLPLESTSAAEALAEPLTEATI